jgi:predicted aspartyl protease
MRRRLWLLAWVVAATALADAPSAAAPAPDDVPAEAVLAELPFLFHPAPYRIFVDLAPRDASRRLIFLLDTGATHAIATPRAANHLGIRVRRHKRDPYRRKTLLGRDVQVYVDTRYSDTGSRTGWEEAVLGGEFLAKYVVELDFDARRVRLLHARRFEVPESVSAPDEAVVPMKMRSNRPGIEIVVNGEPVVALLDTGAPPPLILSGEVAEAAGLPESELPSFRTDSTVGPMVSELRPVAKLEVGPFVLSDLPAVVNPRGWYNLAMSSDSAVGYELLEQFLVRLDYPRRRIWLKRRPDAPRRFLGREYQAFEDLLRPEPAPVSEPTPASEPAPDAEPGS